MIEINRHIEQNLERIARLYKVLLISGPRQVGKTFLAFKKFPNHKWVLLDSQVQLEQAKNDPALFLKNNPPPVIFDEVQRVPQLIREIKNLVDSENLQLADIVLTGSQPLQLMSEVSESLAGRLGIIELTPCTPFELSGSDSKPLNLIDLLKDPPIGKTFPLADPPVSHLFRGGMPAMALSGLSHEMADVNQRITDYVSTYLTRDLRDLGNVKDLGRFERWLRVLSSVSGKVPNILELAGQIGLPQSTANDWLGLLKASLLLYEIPAYSTNRLKRESKKPKIALFDSGLVCNLLGYTDVSQLQVSPFIGSIFETAVITALRSQCVRQLGRQALYHWRAKEKVECDLVLELDANTLVPIEIKYSTSITNDELNGVKTFLECYNSAKLGLVISPYEKCYSIEDKIVHLPWGAL